MQTPAAPAQQAGLVATSAQMNQLAAAAAFLLSPPFARAGAQASAQSITAATFTAINWAQPLADRDLTWLAAAPTLFTLNTAGFYEVAARVILNSSAVTAEGFITVTTGPANPAGSGLTSNFWHTSSVCGPASQLSVTTQGLIPVYMYTGDSLSLRIRAQANCATSSNTGSWGDWSHKMVSL